MAFDLPSDEACPLGPITCTRSVGNDLLCDPPLIVHSLYNNSSPLACAFLPHPRLVQPRRLLARIARLLCGASNTKHSMEVWWRFMGRL